MKGGRGKIRDWAVGQAALLRGMASYIVRLEGRTDVARHPKIQVLKRILYLQRANAPPALPAPSGIQALPAPDVASSEVALGHETQSLVSSRVEPATAAEEGEDSLTLGLETQPLSFEGAVIAAQEALMAETLGEDGDSVVALLLQDLCYFCFSISRAVLNLINR